MAIERVTMRQIMLSAFDREATFDAGPAGWTSTSACQFTEYDENVVFQWDDLLQGNDDVVTGFERNTKQVIARQSVRFPYREPRVKPNTLATFLGLAGGTIATTQDGSDIAYRHRISPADPVSLPSIAGQIKFHGGEQRLYTGLKSNQVTLANNGPFYSLAADILGSGSRATSATAFVAAIEEAWLLWGYSKVFLKSTGGTPISTTLATPSQSTANLGGSEVNLSANTIGFSWTENLNLPADDGYRPNTGMVRGNTHTPQRIGTVTLRVDVDTDTEAAQLDYYLSQSPIALELQQVQPTLIDAAGTFFYGFTLIFPQVQFTGIPRGVNNKKETLEFQASVMEDETNPAWLAFVYNSIPAYLA